MATTSASNDDAGDATISDSNREPDSDELEPTDIDSDETWDGTVDAGGGSSIPSRNR